jgi:two-component system LytT family sensor kinase
MVWTTIACMVLFSHPRIGPEDPLARFEEQLTWLQLISLTSLILLFYGNTFWLIPAFFQRRKLLVFVLIQMALSVLFIAVESIFFDHVAQNIRIPPLPPPFVNDDRSIGARAPGFGLPWGMLILPILLTIAASLAYRYIVDSLKESHQRKERQMANLTSELQLLKSQVSPHFLFNVLNGLAFLARKKSERLEPALIKLSSLMRYMIYDAEGSQVLLKKEIQYLNDYIDLQKMRYQELRINVFFHNDGERLLIAPMILIPFVENAFKHAAGFVDERVFIKIELSTNTNKLYFSVVTK